MRTTASADSAAKTMRWHAFRPRCGRMPPPGAPAARRQWRLVPRRPGRPRHAEVQLVTFEPVPVADAVRTTASAIMRPMPAEPHATSGGPAPHVEAPRSAAWLMTTREFHTYARPLRPINSRCGCLLIAGRRDRLGPADAQDLADGHGRGAPGRRWCGKSGLGAGGGVVAGGLRRVRWAGVQAPTRSKWCTQRKMLRRSDRRACERPTPLGARVEGCACMSTQWRTPAQQPWPRTSWTRS